MTNPPTLSGQDIGQAARATNALLETLLTDAGLPFNTWVALNVLVTTGPQPRAALVQRLTHGLKIAADVAQAAVDELVSRHYASENAPGLQIADAGTALHGRIRAGIDGITERLYGDLPAGDLATTRRILGIVIERANAELAS